MTSKTDSQVIELLGRNHLIGELLKAGLEVATPLRDKGVDLIAYADTDTFSACPIQMKAASAEVFSIHRKYEKFSNLLLAYVWRVATKEPVTFALTYNEALSVADEMGWTKTASWIDGNVYSNTQPGAALKSKLEPYLMTPDKWRHKVTGQIFKEDCI